MTEDCARRIVLLKLTTDRYEASSGFFAIAELLVFSTKTDNWPIRWCNKFCKRLLFSRSSSVSQTDRQTEKQINSGAFTT